MNSNISKKFNRFTTYGESAWNELTTTSPRKQHSKYQNTNKNATNSNKFYSKTTTFNSSSSFSTRSAASNQPAATDKTTANSSRGIEISYQHTAEISAHLLPADKSHQNITSDDQVDSSPAFSPSSESNTSDATDEQEVKTATPELTVQQHHYDPACYYNEYDCHQQQQQQSQPIAYYMPYQDYSQVPNLSGSPLNTSFTGTPQQPQYYHHHYQSIPSYIYDAQSYPVTAYSPVQPSMQHTFHQTPGNNQQITTSLHSPQQQQSSFLAAYQTPPQPAHQLYIQTSNITPPTSLSPNDTPLTSAASNERTTDSPQQQPQQDYSYLMHPYQMQPQQQDSQQQQQLGQYVNYSPITPQQQQTQNYQCNSPLPTAQFMMYNPPPMIPGSPFHTGPNSPMCHTPYANNFTPSKFGHKQRNRFNNNAKRCNKFSYDQQTPQSTYSFDESTQNVYSSNNNNNSSLVMSNGELVVDQQSSAANPETQMPVYPTSSYCDPNMAMPNTEAILNAAYNNFSHIESYGEDYGDAYDDNGDGDDNDENLACQVCRGRRMCFCYFLKVRYYKFPSFFDLVDHQYKKWRKIMACQNLMQQQQQQQFMNSPAMMNSPVQMNTSIGGLGQKA